MNIFYRNKPKTIQCRRLETESNFAEIAFQFPPLGAGTDKFTFHFANSVTNAKETLPKKDTILDFIGSFFNKNRQMY